MINKKNLIEETILQLLEEKVTTNLREIANRSQLIVTNPADRRIIQRVLVNLIKKDMIEAQGNARARVYVKKATPTSQLNQNENTQFKNIPLSKNSINLRNYLSKPFQARKIVGYNQNFLLSYIPNQTSYLSSSIQNDLSATGKVEAVLRPAGTYARNILGRLLVDLSWNSSRLEGNTYSLLETKRLIELGENAEGKDLAEAQMILNHKNAIEYIVESINLNKISSLEVCSIHALLSDNLLGDSSASGRLRSLMVGISGTTYHPIDNPHVIKEYFEIFIEKLNKIKNPYEKSFFSLVHLSYLQAFEDVNKRTARLVSNIPLIKNNLKPLSFIDVNAKDYATSLLGIYEKNDVSLLRKLYVWAYKRSAQRYSAIQQGMGEPDIFKLKYRNLIHDIIREIILSKIAGNQIVPAIKNLIKVKNVSLADENQLLEIIETEIMNLHNGNIARFKIRLSEFENWKKHQNLNPRAD